jgi:hypothetical protein
MRKRQKCLKIKAIRTHGARSPHRADCSQLVAATKHDVLNEEPADSTRRHTSRQGVLATGVGLPTSQPSVAWCAHAASQPASEPSGNTGDLGTVAHAAAAISSSSAM